MKTIKSTGKLNIISGISDGKGVRITSDFLEKLVRRIAIRCRNYINQVSEAPFNYHEKQIHSILAPAIADLTPALLMEYPVNREWTKMKSVDWDDSPGWVDYWCRYRNVDYLIEVKHGRDSYKSKKITLPVQNSWDFMNIKQLGVINKEAKWLSKYSKGVIKIGLHVIITRERNKNPDSLANEQKLLEIQELYHNQLKPKPNWSALWILNEDLVRQSAEDHGKTNDYFPCILLVAKVMEIVQ